MRRFRLNNNLYSKIATVQFFYCYSKIARFFKIILTWYNVKVEGQTYSIL